MRCRGLRSASAAPFCTSKRQTTWSCRDVYSRELRPHHTRDSWPHRLRTLKGLALTFLIHLQHQGVVGRVRPARRFSMNRRNQ
jgi:hypothetical protein